MMKIKILIITILSLLGIACTQNKTTAEGKEQLGITEKEWMARLSPQQYYVLREKGTDRPFTGEYVSTKDKGTYKCAGCGQDLFTDAMKFDSQTGWPSFDREIPGGKIIQDTDNTLGLSRTEISCARCGGHLGHIFDDGPTRTGQRYCVNSSSLTFEPEDQ